MMISPDIYYEKYLKGKTSAQIMTEIRGLKRKINHLKNIMENPEYGRREIIIHPTESVQLSCIRMYLEKAKQALAEVGETYIPTKSELRAAAFEESIPAINKIVFTIGGFLYGYETKIYTLDDEQLHIENEHGIPLSSRLDEQGFTLDKKKLLEGIRRLHLSEWRRHYDLKRFGCTVLDGTQWWLEIYFSNGHKPVKIYGDNAYPYNFNMFKELLDI